MAGSSFRADFMPGSPGWAFYSDGQILIAKRGSKRYTRQPPRQEHPIAPDSAVKRNSKFSLRLLVPVSFLALAAAVPAQDAAAREAKPADAAAGDKAPALPAVDLGDPDAIIKNGDDAYAKGDWLNAAANYSALMTIAQKTGATPDKLEPLYFTLGACLFNIPNYDLAFKTFTEYTQKYPTGKNIRYAQLGLARIMRAQKKWPEAVKQYESLKNEPALRDDVMIELADSYKENEQKDKAIVLLETTLAPGVKTSSDVRLALYLVDLYADDKPEKGVALLDKVKRAPGMRPMISEINFAALKLADALMGDNKPEEALPAYQNLRKHKEVVDTLKELRDDYGRLIKSLSARVGPKDPNVIANQQQLARVKQYEAQAKAMIEALEKEQNYDAVVFYRIGRCFAALGRFWEARLAFQYVLDKFPKFEDAPSVLYALTYCHYNLTPADLTQDNMKMGEETQKLCRQFLSKHPDREETQQVAEMLITIATRSGDPAKINTVYEEVMDLIKDSPNKSVFLAVQVQNYLEQYDFDKARDAADKFLGSAPADDPQREAVEYMRGLTWFFKNDYNGAVEALKAYIEKYPSGQYIADAKYRRAFLVLGEERQKKNKKGNPQFRNVIQYAEDIIKNHFGTPSVADAYALIGDAYKDMTGSEMQDAGLTPETLETATADAYVNAVKNAAAEQVAEYSLTQAAPMLKAQSRWPDLITLYEGFRKQWPENRQSLAAVGEICTAIVRRSDGAFADEIAAAEEKKDEAAVKKFMEQRMEAREKAQAESRQFLAETITENINNPRKDGVEDLMQQLAVAAIPKRKPAPVPPANPAATTDPAVKSEPPKRPPPPTVEELGKPAEAELDRLLGEKDLSAIGKARLVYVKSLLYRNLEAKQPRKKDDKGQYIVDNAPKRSDELMQQLTTEFRPEDYSGRLLAVVGDHLQKAGERDKAAQCYNRLLQFFPQSAFVDWGAVGLGQMALEDKDYETALAKFNVATEEFPGMKYGEALLGKSRALMELKRFGDAEKDPGNSPEKMLKELLGDKTTPPETKAEATWLLGEVRFAQQDYGDAFNYFQRLYLSFLKFPKWVARGYLRAGETKEALQKYTDAKDVYKEAVETPKISERIKGEADFQKIQENYRKL